ncbi:MAG: hypothetical protein ACLFUR_04900 [Candidatus Hadarchaeia archaeon]
MKEKRKEKGGRIEKPTWIAEKGSKIPVRFDTNGLLFADKSRARDFIEKIFDMHRDGNLDRLYVLIDYSLKGANTGEFFWSQGKKLEDIDSEKFSVEDHPQYIGLKNYYEIKNEFLEKDPSFDNSLGITVERGIQNEEDRVYLYSEDSLDWDSMVEKFRNMFECF